MINRDFNVVMRCTDTNNCGETEEAVPPFLPPSHTHVSLKSAELHVDPVSHTCWSLQAFGADSSPTIER